jgi:uncharacterized protein YhbP (UPF0306 family)
MKDSIHTTEKILSENLYITLSSCDIKGNPWISNLYYVYDKGFNFYWYSPRASKHSMLILNNPNVALCLFNSTAVGDDVSALYIQAKAYEITDKKELTKGLLLYGKKMLKTKFVTGKKAYIEFVNSFKDFEGVSPIRLYKAIPEKMWKLAPSEVFNNKYVDSRIELDFKK